CGAQNKGTAGNFFNPPGARVWGESFLFPPRPRGAIDPTPPRGVLQGGSVTRPYPLFGFSSRGVLTGSTLSRCGATLPRADPNSAGELIKWQELAAVASGSSGSAPSSKPTNNVLTAGQLLDEALWLLCRPDVSSNRDDPSVETTVARTALSRFELHCYKAE